MKIALFGYGKMGKEIETLATKNNHEIVLIVDSTNSDLLTSSDLNKADVAIEFSRPDAVISNIKTCFNANLPIVVGTTGWQRGRTPGPPVDISMGLLFTYTRTLQRTRY